MLFSSVRELKAKTSEVLEQTKNGEPVIITSHGKPKAILISADQEDLDDLLLVYSSKLRKKIEEGLQDSRQGRFVPWDEYMKRRSRRKRA